MNDYINSTRLNTTHDALVPMFNAIICLAKNNHPLSQITNMLEFMELNEVKIPLNLEIILLQHKCFNTYLMKSDLIC